VSVSEDTTWHVQHEGGDNPFRWGRCADGFIAEWVGVLTVRTNADGELVSSTSADGASPEAVDKLAQGAGRAFAGWIAGRPSLHAGAVAVDGLGAAVVGPSGAGKSTLVAAMCERDGVELLADDVLLLDPKGWLAEPTESAAYLETQQGVTKRRLPVCDVARVKVPLRLIVDLRYGSQEPPFSWYELGGSERFAVLSSALLRFEATPQRWAIEFERLAALASHLRICAMNRAHNTEYVAAAADAIISRLLAGER